MEAKEVLFVKAGDDCWVKCASCGFINCYLSASEPPKSCPECGAQYQFQPAPDTAKEQAGRKMFEALGIAQEVLSGTASRLSVHGLTHIEIDEVGKRINAALAAGREAGWGQ